MRALFRLIGRFGHDQRGNLAVIFGIAVLPLITAVGCAVDYSQAMRMKAKLQSAADAAAVGAVAKGSPAYVQAGREDHIAPPESVWKLTHHLKGPTTFVLAGSGHIAGVVNPPAAKKYQYWTNDRPGETLREFIAGAEEHTGSWWPHWAEWLRARSGSLQPSTGSLGCDTHPPLAPAPGTYVFER